MRPLGNTQRQITGSLVRWGYWFPHCGWIWQNTSTTDRLLASLVRRGLATKVPMFHGGEKYLPTQAAIDLVKGKG